MKLGESNMQPITLSPVLQNAIFAATMHQDVFDFDSVLLQQESRNVGGCDLHLFFSMLPFQTEIFTIWKLLVFRKNSFQ